MKRIIFIEPNGNEANVFSNYMQLPLTGILYLGTILHEAGYEVRILKENLLTEEIDPYTLQADIYCITALTVSANRARELAGQFKRVYPNATVIIGGIHATLMPETFEKVADHIVLGEAEGIILDLVSGAISQKIVYGAPVQDLDTLPLINYSLLEGYQKISLIPIMTSRGCPFNCEFCTVTKVFGKQFRKQSSKRVIEEIKSALSYFSSKDVFFYDDNFASDTKRVAEICDMLIEQGIVFNWNAQVRTDVTKDFELIKKMAEAHCERLFIGFESINDATLSALHKSQSYSDIVRSIQIIHKTGIKVHGMFMFGEDHDTVANIHKTVDFAIENEIDSVQFMALTPLPGTVLYDRLDKSQRILHKDWNYYDGMYVVFQPREMSEQVLQEEILKAYEKFYSPWRVLVDILEFCYMVSLDALVWNFDQVHRYSISTLKIKLASIWVVKKYRSYYQRVYADTLKKVVKELNLRL